MHQDRFTGHRWMPIVRGRWLKVGCIAILACLLTAIAYLTTGFVSALSGLFIASLMSAIAAGLSSLWSP